MVRPSFSFTEASAPSDGEAGTLELSFRVASSLPSAVGVKVWLAISTCATLPRPWPVRMAVLSPVWSFTASRWMSLV